VTEPRRVILALLLAGCTFFSAVAQEEKVHRTPLRIRILDKETGEEATSFRFKLQSGQQDKNQIFIRNTTPESLDFKFYVADGRTTPDLSLDGPTDRDPCLKTGKWLQLSQNTLSLGPGQSGTVDVTVQVPPETAAADYLGFVFVQKQQPPKVDPGDPSAPGVSFGINVETRIGLPVLCRVGAPQALAVTPLGVEKRYYKNNLSLRCRFRNDGNLLAKPEGTWSVLYPDGTTLVSSPMRQLGYCLPGSEFVVEIPLQGKSESGKAQPLPRGSYCLKMQLQVGTVFPGSEPVHVPVEQQLNLP